MKRILALMLVMALFLTGCGNGEPEQKEKRDLKFTEVATVPVEETEEVFEETPTEETIAETEPVEEIPENWYQEVLEDQRSFIGGGREVFLSDYLEYTLSSPATAYTLVDFDADGVQELLLRLSTKEFGSMILHYEKGYIYSYTFGGRSMTTVYTDGVYSGSAGAAYTIYFKADFNGAILNEETVAYGDSDQSAYTLNGEACTKAQLQEYIAQREYIPTVSWIELEVKEEPKPEYVPKECPYLFDVIQLNIPSYKEPSYDSQAIEVVDKQGWYTIMEERVDEEGHVWGRLKMGTGWIDLADAARSIPVSVSHDVASLRKRYPIVENVNVGGTLSVLIFVDLNVTDFSVVQIEHPWGSNAYISKTYEQRSILCAGEGVQITMGFFGDAQESDVGVTFVDANGIRRCYYITDNGRNNALHLVEVQL